MPVIMTVLVILALIAFAIVAFWGEIIPKINLIAFGLALWMLTIVIGRFAGG